MKTSGYIKDDKGIALVAALIIMLLLLTLGATAMMMSQLGFTAISAEKKYQLANWAAEYGVYKGVERVVSNAICPDTAVTTDTLGSTSYSYSYFGIKDKDDSYCMIKAVGEFGTAKVHKTVVVPRAGADWGAMVAKGCNITLSGSSGIAGCDDDESRYEHRCGVITALIHDGANVNSNAVSETITQCRAEGTIRGLDGNPPELRSPKTFQDELVKKYFQVTDTDTSGSAWDELLEKIEVHYSNANRKIEFFDQTKSATRFGLPVTTTGAGLIPTSPGGVCDPVFVSGTPACCITTAGNSINCYSNVNCSTGLLTPIAPIDLTTCKPAQTDTNYNNYPYIAVGDNTVAYININPLNTPNKIGTQTRWQINQSGFRLAFVGNKPDDPVTITSDINDTRIYTGGAVTINGKLSAADGNPGPGSVIYAGGNVTINANIGNHNANPNPNEHEACSSSFVFSTHIISGNTVTITSQNIINTNIFANNINISSQPDIQGGRAKVFYALTRIDIDTNGSPCIGYPCGNKNDLYPLLFLVGDGNPATGGSSFVVEGTGGNLTMDGMLFTDANSLSMTGAVEFQGTIINISNNCNIQTTGNAVIQFNKRVLDGVFNQLCSSIMQPVKCGGGNKKDYITNTETTVY